MTFLRNLFPFPQTSCWAGQGSKMFPENIHQMVKVELDSGSGDEACDEWINQNEAVHWQTVILKTADVPDQQIKRKKSKIEKIMKKTCNFCNLKVTSIIQHCDTKHRNEDGNLQCPFCSKIYRSVQAHCLVKHLKFHDPSCEFCNVKFPKIVLEKHVGVCENKNSLSCGICCLNFKNESQRKLHFRTCNRDPIDRKFKKMYLCYICGQTRYGDSNFISHLKSCRNEKKHKCSTCGKGFNLFKTMKIHEKCHIELPKNCVCETCGKSFSDKNKLDQHKITHTSELPYKCKDCGRGFNRQWNFTQHKRIHSGVMPYECPICKERFRHNVTMKQHKAKFHPESSKTVS